jgi:hypothetical protein
MGVSSAGRRDSVSSGTLIPGVTRGVIIVEGSVDVSVSRNLRIEA